MERDPRELPPEVDRIGLAPQRVMQRGIDVVEDRVLADPRRLAVAVAEPVQRPVGDVVDPLAGGSVTIARKTERATISLLKHI